MKYQQLSTCAVAVLAALSSSAWAENAGKDLLEIKEALESNYSSGSTACVITNDDFESSPMIADLKAYIEVINSNTKEHVEALPYAKGESLCVPGLQNGQSYALILKKGLISSSGKILEQDVQKQITLHDAEPRLFMDSGVLLPRSESDGKLYVKTINIDKLKVELYKINRKQLIDSEYSQYLYDNLSSWMLEPLITNFAEKVAGVELNTEGKRNERVALPIDLNALYGKSPEDGVYLLSVRDASLSDEAMLDSDLGDRHFSRLIIASDLGVTAYKGFGLVKLAVRSLKSANPVPGAEVNIISRSGRSLYATRTDADGFANIPYEALSGKDALRASAATIDHGNDFFMLPLSADTSLSLESITGVPYEGPIVYGPKEVKAMAMTDRGIVRPGEKINFTVLVRARDLSASDLKALVLKLRRTDGLLVSQMTAPAKGAGFFETTFEIPDKCNRGQWSLEACSGDRVLAETSFQVADFVPGTVTAKMGGNNDSLRAGKKESFLVSAFYNYGSPAAKLNTESHIDFFALEHPFSKGKYQDYSFGPNKEEAEKINSKAIDPEAISLSDQGKGLISATMPDFPYAVRSLFSAIVYAGGTIASTDKNYTLFPSSSLIGIKVNDDRDKISLISCDDQGNAKDEIINYTIKRRLRDYQFVLEYGNWHYVPQIRKYAVMSSSANSGQDGINIDIAELEDGEYEITSTTKDGGKSSLIFYKGYALSEGIDSPDKLEVSCDKASYKVGEKATLSFIAPREGTLDLIFGTDEITKTLRFDVKKGHNSISFKVDNSFEQGTHVLLSLSSAATASPAPVHAFGLSYIAVDSDSKKLDLKLEAPDSLRPEEELKAELSVSNPQDKVNYFVALVDEGVLNLTSFKTPDPFTYFTTPAKYEIQVNDLCNRLLRAFSKGDQGYGDDPMLYAGAASTPEALSQLKHKVIAIHQGITEAVHGKAQISFKVPHHQGALRLMVIAADSKGVGSAQKSITIHDKTAQSLSLPSILHMGDKLASSININNLELDTSALSLDLECKGSIKCDTLSGHKIDIAKGDQLNIPFNVNAESLGTGQITYSIKGGDYQISDKAEVITTEPSISAFMQAAKFVKKGESAELKLPLNATHARNAQLSSGFLPYLSMSQLREIVSSHTTYDALSTALSLTALLTVDDNVKTHALVRDLVVSLQTFFDRDGSIENVHSFTTALACGALLSAQKQGYYVSSELTYAMFNQLKNFARYETDTVRALALEQLANLNAVNISQLRYSLEQCIQNDLSPLEAAAFSRAFKLTGDEEHAHSLLINGIEKLSLIAKLDDAIIQAPNDEERDKAISKRRDLENAPVSYHLYDTAVLFAMAALNKDEEAIEKFDLTMFKDCSWDLATTSALLIAAGQYPQSKTKDVEAPDGSYQVTNDGDSDEWYMLQALAVPQNSSTKNDDLSFKMEFLDENLKPIANDATIKAYKKTFVTYTIDRKATGNNDMIIRTSLPSGFTLEKMLDDQSGIKDAVIPYEVEQGDEGLVITLKSWQISNMRHIKLVLGTRADLKGQFVVPATQISDPSIPGLHIYTNDDVIKVD